MGLVSRSKRKRKENVRKNNFSVFDFVIKDRKKSQNIIKIIKKFLYF